MENNIEEKKITSEIKTKNPKRVEAGKRLAAISKEAKEKKMRLKINSEQKESYLQSPLTLNNIFTVSILLLIAVLSLYYINSKKGNVQVKQEKAEKDLPEPLVKKNFLETL